MKLFHLDRGSLSSAANKELGQRGVFEEGTDQKDLERYGLI